jgi:transcriptional regulator with XRE-family HTH domain
MKKVKDEQSILLGRRIRTLRTAKGLTQQELGNRADVDYKFIGEIERGNMNPSFKVLVKIAKTLDVELPEILRFEQEISDKKELESRITKIPGWPLENPPPVAGSKSPTSVSAERVLI